MGDTIHEARSIFTSALRRESGDRGVEAARESIARDLDGIVLPMAGVDLKVRAERLATADRIHSARTREWELATANWERRHPGIFAADPAPAIAALEYDHRSATETVSRLERERVAAVERVHITTWERDFATVEHTRVSAEDATVFRRRNAQELHEIARRAFIAAHRHEPTPQPPEQLRDIWRRDAIQPGRDERLDAARKQVEDTRRKLERLQRDPAPSRPTAPTVGTPAQEAAKDARYLQNKERLEHRPTKSAEIRGPRVPTRDLER